VRAQRDKLRDLEESAWPEPAPAGARVRFGALPTHAAQVAKALAPLGARLEWLPTLGLGFASRATVDPAALQGARRELAALGGWLAADGDWGPAPGSLGLQRSVKQRLDPAGVLAPGRFLV
jgi:glycolate oxidase FAD binding subunit